MVDFEDVKPSPSTSVNNSAESDFEDPQYTDKLDQKVASSIEFSLRMILDHPWNIARMKEIKVQGDNIDLFLRFPLVFPDPEPDPEVSGWLGSLREQKRYRREFAASLRRPENQKALANFFQTRLANFALDKAGLGRFPPNLKKRLRRLAQKCLAGRPEGSIPHNQRKRLTHLAVEVSSTLRDMQENLKLRRAKRRSMDQRVAPTTNRTDPTDCRRFRHRSAHGDASLACLSGQHDAISTAVFCTRARSGFVSRRTAGTTHSRPCCEH